jgi:D-alanine-D-alanine ligase-like ATP-grasp enzyme
VAWSPPARLTVIRELWRPHPLAWIHRAEARSIVAELRDAGCDVRTAPFRAADAAAHLSPEPALLRLSDPVMLEAARALTAASVAYIGPSAEAMGRCYDKYESWRIASAAGVDSPATMLARDADAVNSPLILKPRCGSDSIGVRLLRRGPIPARLRTECHVVQERIVGAELTIAVLHGRVGMPLQIFLPEGTPYSFARKYFWRPDRATVADAALADRVRNEAQRVATVLGVDWAARIDLIHEAATGRLRFLECDVAPLIGARSAFAASLAALGVGRAEQLRLLLGGVHHRGGTIHR